jgi:hypothetical protein
LRWPQNDQEIIGGKTDLGGTGQAGTKENGCNPGGIYEQLQSFG